MRLSRNTWYLASVTLVLGVFGCNDQPTAGEPAPRTSAADFFNRAPAPGFDALEWREPIRLGIEEHQEIGPEGGVIRLPDAGVEIRFPREAVSERVLIDAVAIPGSVVAFRFGAHGLTFDGPVEIRIDSNRLSGSWLDQGSIEITNNGRLLNYSRGLLGVYFEGESTSNVIPLDTLPIYVDEGHIVLEISHFSGYAVASGR